jgi:hypothetical protein
MVFQAAVATASCLVTALMVCTSVSRPLVLELLQQISAGQAAPSEIDCGNARLPEQCRQHICGGMGYYCYFLEHGTRSDQSLCVDLLSACAEENALFHEKVLWHLNKYLHVGTDASLLQLTHNTIQYLHDLENVEKA